MDQFDEFEIKPLTAGLGFHKKPVSLKDHVAKAGLSREKTARMPTAPAYTGDAMGAPGADNKPRSKEQILSEIKEALKPIQKPTQRMTETLPRGPEDVRATSEIEVPKPSTRTPMDIVNFEIPSASINDTTLSKPSIGARRGGHDTKIRELVPVPFSLASTILDGIIVLAFSLIFMMSLVFVTGVDLVAVISSASREIAAQLSLGVLYLAVWQMYVVVARSFFGATLGEWTFDMQLGDKTQMAETLYPAKVLLRSFAIMLTGFILLPVLSLLSRRDLASKVSGLQLYRRNV
jgi:hypothetical protein